jgi:hypothetical protein
MRIFGLSFGIANLRARSTVSNKTSLDSLATVVIELFIIYSISIVYCKLHIV